MHLKLSNEMDRNDSLSIQNIFVARKCKKRQKYWLWISSKRNWNTYEYSIEFYRQKDVETVLGLTWIIHWQGCPSDLPFPNLHCVCIPEMENRCDITIIFYHMWTLRDPNKILENLREINWRCLHKAKVDMKCCDNSASQSEYLEEMDSWFFWSCQFFRLIVGVGLGLGWELEQE